MVKPGDVIADYKVIDFAGSGGMGTVYKIEHIITRRIEAMKVLPIGMGSGTEEVERFKREIQIHARLNHPNIATLYNAIRDGHSIALVMEYVDGVSLQHLLDQGPLRLKIAVEYAVQVLDALSYAHEHGVIHRDVSPANIIITLEGIAKLTDFGLARAATDLRLTTSGVAVGSHWYMSPEQVRAVDTLDARTDIYAMGAVLHEMLTGKKLFEASGSFEVMRSQMETIPLPPSAHNPRVQPALDAVVAKAVAKDPATRFQSAGEFRLALATAFGGELPSLAASRRNPGALGRRRWLGARVPSRIFSLWTHGKRSRAAAVLALAAISAVCAMSLWHGKAPVASRSRAPRSAVASAPASPTNGTVPTPAPAAVAPSVPFEEPPAPVRSVSTPASSARRTGKQRVATSARSAAETAPTVTPASALISTASPTAPADLGPTKKSAEVLQPPQAPPEVNAPPSVESSGQTPEATMPPPAGNRIIKALRKLSPFHKHPTNSSKSE